MTLGSGTDIPQVFWSHLNGSLIWTKWHKKLYCAVARANMTEANWLGMYAASAIYYLADEQNAQNVGTITGLFSELRDST